MPSPTVGNPSAPPPASALRRLPVFALGFLVTFLFGGLPGVLLASPPINFHVTDSYFVVAHFHTWPPATGPSPARRKAARNH